jgi:light-regulated signal transduction histidine kinase (bacteriophytochrome)
LHARLLNQADETDDVLAALMEQVDRDLTTARMTLVDDLQRAEDRAGNTIALTVLVTLAAAVLLATWVTRSIEQPLATLDAGARALAAGDFNHRVPLRGTDELARLAAVFNKAAEELAALFNEVGRARGAAEAAQAALEQRAHELARANADLRQFAYSASHDLQEPLRTVALYSERLQAVYGGQLDRRGKDYLGYITAGARQMGQLLNDLRAYAQAASTTKAEDARTDVKVVFDRVLQGMQAQISAQRCTVRAEQLPVVRAHEVHVHQLLQNLIGNAIKYRGQHDPEISISAESKDGQCLFAVRDNGIGIDPQYSKQIFGIFKRLHGNEYEGTGIGLAICQRIVEGYGGQIWVESEVGKGSTFRFTLPAD